MNNGQAKFLAFFLAYTQPEYHVKVQQLLQASFAAQAQQKLTVTNFQQLQSQLLPLLKPEGVSAVKQAMAQFSQQLH